MADELHFYGIPSTQSGLTVIARIYDTAGTQLGSDVSCAEVGSLALYIGDMPAAGAGQYGVRFFESGATDPLSTGYVDWNGSAEVTLATIAAQISALNNFDPANDAVANVTLVGTTTTNTDMRGNDNANTVQPDNAAIAATLAALGSLNDPTAGDIVTALQAVAGDFQADLTGVATTADVNALSIPTAATIATAVEAALINEGDGQQLIDAIVQAIGNTNLDQVAVVAAIRADLERAGGSLDNLPTLAEMEASADLTAGIDAAGIHSALDSYSNKAGYQADASALATQASVDALNDPSTADIVSAMQVVADDFKADLTGVGTSPADIYTYFTDTSREDLFKADVSGLPTLAQIEASPNVGGGLNETDLHTALDNYSNKTDYQADVSGIGGGDTAADIYTYFTDASREDAFKADVSTAVTAGDIAPLATSQDLLALSIPTAAEIATEVQAGIINEGDGQQVINAMVTAIGNTNIDQVAFVAAIRADLERNGGLLDNLPTLTEIEASPNIGGSSGLDEAGLHTALDNYSNKANWKDGVPDFSSALTAIGDLHNFDPANDTVARVTLVDTTTANSDMRGTDAAFLAVDYTAPPTAAAVYAEFVSGTNEEPFQADLTQLPGIKPTIEFGT